MNEIFQMAIDENKTLKNEIEKLKTENDTLIKENEILSNNADTAFQDSLNENQALFAKEILSKFISKFKEKTGFDFNDTQEIIIPERVLREIFKEMEIEL